MSNIKKQVSFEGLTYNTDNRDRIAAAVALEALKGGVVMTEGYVLSGSGDVGASATSGQLFVTSSTAVTGSHTMDSYHVLCVKI